MAEEIKMPQLSDTMSDGRILTWLKKEGDSVSRGDALAEVATDKADLEIESFFEGTLLKIHRSEGETVNVGEVIAVVGEPGESVAESAKAAEPSDSADAPTEQSRAQSSEQASEKKEPDNTITLTDPIPSASNGSSGDRIKISPLAKNLAKAHGVDYSALQGSGEGGRIVKKDIEARVGGPLEADAEAAKAQQAAPAAAHQAQRPPSPAPVESRTVIDLPELQAGSQELSRMRQTIAARMVESTTTIPHFYVTTKVHVDELNKVRKSLKALPQYEGITYNHLIVKGVALALRSFPRINTAYRDGQVVQPGEVNVGVVTALPDGLLIPVIKNADVSPLADIVAEGRALVQRARSGRPKPDDLVGGTFSISNMGPFGIEQFTAIISPGQGAILAVSSVVEEAIVKDGQVSSGLVLRLTLSVDHRIIDGVMAGEFLKELTRLLEDPVLLLA